MVVLEVLVSSAKSLQARTLAVQTPAARTLAAKTLLPQQRVQQGPLQFRSMCTSENQLPRLLPLPSLLALARLRQLRPLQGQIAQQLCWTVALSSQHLMLWAQLPMPAFLQLQGL